MAKKPAVEIKVIPFTGIARTVECYENQGFRNFRVVSLWLKDGVVVKVKKSDPYASFEAGSRLDLANDYSLLSLNTGWADGNVMKANPNVAWENRPEDDE